MGTIKFSRSREKFLFLLSIFLSRARLLSMPAVSSPHFAQLVHPHFHLPLVGFLQYHWVVSHFRDQLAVAQEAVQWIVSLWADSRCEACEEMDVWRTYVLVLSFLLIRSCPLITIIPHVSWSTSQEAKKDKHGSWRQFSTWMLRRKGRDCRKLCADSPGGRQQSVLKISKMKTKFLSVLSTS